MGESTRKRKSDDIVEDSPNESTRAPDFVRRDPFPRPATPLSSRELFFEKPTTPLNSRDAFFDKNNSRTTSLLTDSPADSDADTECVIKSSKSFIDDIKYKESEESYRFTTPPRRSPTSFRHELQKKPFNHSPHGDTPCGVVDELFTGFYGCMPAWDCAMPWRENEDDITDDSDDEEDDHRYGIVRRDATRHDALVIKQLSFPKQLGKEFVSQMEQSQLERQNKTLSRTIRRTPSSRLTTLESDSRQKMAGGSKMRRRTELSTVTEIHWDEKVSDLKTLENMAKLSVF